MPRQPKKQEVGEEEAITVDETTAAKEVQIIIPEHWTPKTKLGKDVVEGKVTDIDKLFSEGVRIIEAPIVDVLLPNLEKEIVLIGGSTGKGGGIRRTPFKRTTRMHKSGRRYKISVMVVVGNRDGYVGLGLSSGPPGKHQEVIEKSLNKAKLNLIPVRRGCGSWECLCGTSHSIPFAVSGKSGSVTVELFPAPKGVGLAISDEVKKLMRLAGITDIWAKSRGQTSTRINLLRATFDALQKLNAYRLKPEFEKHVGLKIGRGS